MRAAFIPALPPSALLAGMIAPSFRLVNRFCVKSCFARAAAVSGRPRCARYSLGRRSLMCCFARAAAVSGRPRCARYGLGRRSLAGGSHTHPTLAMAWAVFAANAGGASVSSALVAQETRHVPPGTDRRRASRPHQPSGGLEGSADPSKCIPNPATCAVDSVALRQQGVLTPAAARRSRRQSRRRRPLTNPSQRSFFIRRNE